MIGAINDLGDAGYMVPTPPCRVLSGYIDAANVDLKRSPTILSPCLRRASADCSTPRVPAARTDVWWRSRTLLIPAQRHRREIRRECAWVRSTSAWMCPCNFTRFTRLPNVAIPPTPPET